MAKRPNKKRLREYSVYELKDVMIGYAIKASSREQAALKCLNMKPSGGTKYDNKIYPTLEHRIAVYKRGKPDDCTNFSVTPSGKLKPQPF